jgi:tetratricopeptide (TPR) repeat protein
MSGLAGCASIYSMNAPRIVRALNIIAILLVGFLLAAPHATLAQGLDEATALTQQVIELTKQGHYSEAVPLAQHALAIREKALGLDHPDVATSLNSLAFLYSKQGRYAAAEPLYKTLTDHKGKVLRF